jgi:hypothetical protein
MKTITQKTFSKCFFAVLLIALIAMTAKVEAATYYVRTNGSTAWGNITGSPTPVTLPAGNAITAFTDIHASATGADTYYFAPGTYNINFTFAITTGQVYGGFSGNETSTADLSARAISDQDANGIIEPWEFTNVVTFTTSVLEGNYGASNTTGGTANRLLTVTGTGGEVNGITLFDYFYKSSGSAHGVIVLGEVNIAPTDGLNSTKAGKLTQCIVRQFKNYISNSTAANGIVMLTNANSVVDKCLIEDCRIPYGSGTVYMNKYGGIVSNSVIRNNHVGGASLGFGGGISLANTPATTVDAIVSNCAIYNNTGVNGGAIRGAANSTSSKGIQIINCTVVNNSSTGTNGSSIELINSGLIANSISLSDTQNEIRPNTSTNYIVSTIYGTNPGSAIFPSSENNNTSGIADNTFTALYFVRPTSFQGAVSNSTTENASYTLEKKNEIKAANYQITSTSSLAHTTPSAILPASFKASGGSGSDIAITATVPTTDITGLTRTGSFTIGAYQATAEVTTGNTLTISNPATLVSVNVNSGGTLTVNPGKQLTVSTTFSNSGTLNLLSDGTSGTATIITPEAIGESGATYNVQQYITSSAKGPTGRNWYISSPLSAASSSVITTATGNGLVYYDGTPNWPDAGETMEIMKGYIAKSPEQNTTINFTGGTLNTGDKSVTDLPIGFNLVGNPYASYVDFAQATRTNVEESIWYRSKRTGSYVFQTYNVPSNIGANDGTAIIPPMQSFWIKTTSATNTLGFTNTMRSHQDQSVLTNRLKAPKASTQQLLRLQVSNATNSDETVLYFNPEAQNTFDGYDSQKMFNNISNVPEIYTRIGTTDMVINGMSTIPYNTEIPLGFSTAEAGNFSITASEFKYFESGTSVLLKDKLQPATEIQLNEGAVYHFSSQLSTGTDRFSLIFRAPGTTTGVTVAEKLNAQVFVNADNQITIIAPERCSYAIYNSVGQKVKEGVTASNNYTSNIQLSTGMYVVRVSDKSKEFTSKLFIK